jgi:hypothetical protein
LAKQVLDQRIGSIPHLSAKLGAWHAQRSAVPVRWRFSTKDARIKLRRLYPDFHVPAELAATARKTRLPPTAPSPISRSAPARKPTSSRRTRPSERARGGWAHKSPSRTWGSARERPLHSNEKRY